METRLLVWEGDGVRGATYRRNAEQTEAHLLAAGVTARVGDREWTFPSRSDCIGCHTRAAGSILGLTTEQFNRRQDLFGTGEVAQIDALQRIGYLTGAPRPAAELSRFPDPGDGAAPVAPRARAYLHANCAHCHRPGGLSNATIDVRAEVPLHETRGCGVRAQQGDLGIPGALVLEPGKPARSTLLLRMLSTDRAVRMPPMASSMPDAEGATLVRAWIAGLGGCGP